MNNTNVTETIAKCLYYHLCAKGLVGALHSLGKARLRSDNRSGFVNICIATTYRLFQLFIKPTNNVKSATSFYSKLVQELYQKDVIIVITFVSIICL